MKKKYIVTLTDEEREMIKGLISSGKGAARKLTHARILLKADSSKGGPNWKDKDISISLDVGTATIERVRKLFVEEGLEAALTRKKSNRIYERKLDGEKEAYLIALACSEPPKGYARWTLRLLADQMVALEYIDEISHTAIYHTLKKTSLSLG